MRFVGLKDNETRVGGRITGRNHQVDGLVHRAPWFKTDKAAQAVVHLVDIVPFIGHRNVRNVLNSGCYNLAYFALAMNVEKLKGLFPAHF
ncbi:hypothetical protein IWQ54_006220 [Labrenzia sp. EL_195]|nr:hypothetical protein [Labrenzia sp. EL_195]